MEKEFKVTFREIVKSNLNKNWKPTQFTKKEILGRRVTETMGELVTQVDLADTTPDTSVLSLTFGDKQETFNIAWSTTDNGWYRIKSID